jgi:class 3 adenylate cyclase/tetratricopeptide (TPR) repeat protein
MTDRKQLEEAIAALESQRGMLGDAVVNPAIAGLRSQLAGLVVEHITQTRKQVTVLFADISGFTAMSETLDAEEVSDIMNSLWQRLDACIVEQGGVIDKHLGDGVMALWSAKVAREDDPELAVHAALAMQEAASQFSVSGVNLTLRIGIHTGPVLLGGVGTTGEFSAVGDTVNLASRLEEASPIGGVLISHDTYRHVRGIFEVVQQEPIQVKGKAKPQQTYLVQGAKPRAFRMETRGVEGIETRMVGRDVDLLTLQNVYRDAMEDGETRIVTIVGEAGVGKSRLLYEFEKWIGLLPDKTNRFNGWATPGTQATSYGAIRRMFARRFEILESDSAATVRDKFRAGMAVALEADRADLAGQLIGFDLPASQALQRALQSPLFREQALAGLTDYFRAVAHEPTVIFLEDMHWADDSSLDLMDHLAGALPEARLLVVCLARPALFERRPGWGEGLETHMRLQLKALSRRESRALVAEILQRAEEIPVELRDLVVEGAEGNPFYVEELIKMLIDDGVIRGGEGRWQVEVERLAEVHVPPTLAGVLQARLDSLPVEERSLLQRASVVGRLFWDMAVAELATDEEKGFGKDELTPLLKAVRDRELVFRRERSAFAGAEEYTFKHALLRDVTYETVLLKLRRVYHKQVAAWLESSAGERLGEYLGLIAAHYEMAGQTEKAIAFLAQAGDRAFKLSANQEAVVHFSRGIELLRGLPDSAERTGQELRLQLPLAIALMHLKGYGDSQVWQAFTRAHELCDQIGDTPQIAAALHGLGAFYCAKTEYKSAIALAERILRIAPKAPDPTTLLLVGHNGQTANFSLVGDLAQALEHAQQVLKLYDPQQHRTLIYTLGVDLKTVTMSYTSTNLWLRGYPDQARQTSREALVLSRELSHPPTLSFALNFASMLFHSCRDEQRFRELTEEWLALSTEYGILLFAIYATVLHGRSLCEEGLIVDGLAKMHQGLDALRAAGTGTFRPYLLAMLAEAYRKVGKPQDGLAALEEGLTLVEKSGERFYEAEIRRLKGELLLARSADETEVEKHYQHAIAVARQLEAKSLELRAVMSLSQLWQKSGKREQARQMLGEIYSWFTEGFDTADLQEAKTLLKDLSA